MQRPVVAPTGVLVSRMPPLGGLCPGFCVSSGPLPDEGSWKPPSAAPPAGPRVDDESARCIMIVVPADLTDAQADRVIARLGSAACGRSTRWSRASGRAWPRRTHTEVVREHLGHSSYAITADIYGHVGPGQQREAADRLDQALHW